MKEMTTSEAVAILIDFATRFGENAEEVYPRRIKADDDDDTCRRLAEEAGEEPEYAIELRDLWRAVIAVQPLVEDKA